MKYCNIIGSININKWRKTIKENLPPFFRCTSLRRFGHQFEPWVAGFASCFGLPSIK